MQAAVLHRYNSPLEIVERPDLKPRPGWILVDVRGCGVCGSDVFLRKGGFNSTLPIVPGHEASGVVRELGEGVDPSVAPPGTPVALYYIEHCGVVPDVQHRPGQHVPQRAPHGRGVRRRVRQPGAGARAQRDSRSCPATTPPRWPS